MRSGVARRFSAIWFCCALLLAGAAARNARAAFIGPYALAGFTLTNSQFANGYWSSTDPGTLVLTGPNDGSAQAGTTDFTIAAASAGMVQFDYLYSSLDSPGYDYAGYTLSNTFYQFADTDGQAGSIAFSVNAGDIFGFEVGSLDNEGEPGVLTITNFDAPASAPEPGSLRLVLLGAGAFFVIGRRRWIRYAARMRLGAWMGRGAMICLAIPLTAQQPTYYGSNVTGQLVLSGVVNLSQQAQTQTHMAALRNGALEERLRIPFAGGMPGLKIGSPEILRRIPSSRLHPPIAESALAPLALAAAPTHALTVSTSTTSSGFNALSHLDQRDADGGDQFSIEPPNGSIAVANGYALEGVNDAIQVYSVSGSPSLPIVLSSNQVFGLAPAIDRTTGVNGVYLTDMRVYFDQSMSRWIVLQRSQDEDVNGNPLPASHLYMAVSQTADPTGSYNIYIMDTTNGTHPRCPCIADFPQIGSDQYGFHIAWNEFDYFSGFVDASILSISKASLVSGAGKPTAYQFFIPYVSRYEFSIQPATTPPGASNFLANGGLEYFVSTGATGSGVALWAVYNTSSLATGNPNLTLTVAIVPTTLSYNGSPAATQRPGPLPYGSSLTPPGVLAYLDSIDPRVLSLSYASGRLFLALQVGVNDANSNYVAGAAYLVLSPTYRNGVLAASVLNQGSLFVNGNHLLRPAVAVNALGYGDIAVTLVGPDWYPSAAFIPISAFSTPSTVQIAGLGTLPEDGFTGYPGGGYVGTARWGDYNSAFAASDGAIWMAVQYIGTYPRTPFANWNTYVARIQP